MICFGSEKRKTNFQLRILICRPAIPSETTLLEDIRLAIKALNQVFYWATLGKTRSHSRWPAIANPHTFKDRLLNKGFDLVLGTFQPTV